MKQVFCQIEKCLACRTCELACATEHSQSKELVEAIREHPKPKHRVHVVFVDGNGSLNRTRAMAIQCRHCAEPVCAQACISGGIYQDERTGEILINADKCVACWSCIMVCPFGIIVRNNEMHQVVKCDLCQDRETPACVEACPTKALVFCEPDDMEIECLEK